MENSSSNSLLKRAWRGALVLFGTAVLLWATVRIVAQIWPWLVAIVIVAVTLVALATVLLRWRDRSRW